MVSKKKQYLFFSYKDYVQYDIQRIFLMEKLSITNVTDEDIIAFVESPTDINLEYTEHLRCPNCQRKTTGEKDFYSLVKGSTNIKKTCLKCRRSTYDSYKKNNADKFKKNKVDPIDYNKEYLDHLRCRTCNRPTKGIEDFKNIKSGKITKTCLNCRVSVYASVKKNPRVLKKKITNKEKLACFAKLIEPLNKEKIKDLAKNIDDDRFKAILGV